MIIAMSTSIGVQEPTRNDLERLKREVVFYRYPRDGHEMSRSGEPHHRVDRLNRMVEWFDKYCKKRRTTD